MGCCFGRDRGSVTSEDVDDGLSAGKNRPLVFERVKWKSDVPLTEGQLRGKRDEFWDTAPAFDGRKEIWDALRAAVSHAEQGDLLLAQAIIDGANIALPDGTLRECYDELGGRYQIPIYCLCAPVNLVDDQSEESSSCVNLADQPSTCLSSSPRGADWLPLKFRISRPADKNAPDGLTDLRLYCLRHETVHEAKTRLHAFTVQRNFSVRHTNLRGSAENFAKTARRVSNADVLKNATEPRDIDHSETVPNPSERTFGISRSVKDPSNSAVHCLNALPTDFPTVNIGSSKASLCASTVSQVAEEKIDLSLYYSMTADTDAVLMPLIVPHSPTCIAESCTTATVPHYSSHSSPSRSAFSHPSVDSSINVVEAVPPADRQRWLFGGSVLSDRSRLDDCRLASNFVVHVLTSDRPFAFEKHRSFGFSAAVVGGRLPGGRCRRSRRSKCHPAGQETPMTQMAGPSSSNATAGESNVTAIAPPTHCSFLLDGAVVSNATTSSSRDDPRKVRRTSNGNGQSSGSAACTSTNDGGRGKRRSNKKRSTTKKGGVKSPPTNQQSSTPFIA